ncbi:MAG: hypothetical protein ACOY81_09605 [Bacillota bacterium]
MPSFQQQKIRQYGLWLLVIGPALFFAVYYFAQTSPTAIKQQTTLPTNIFTAGQNIRFGQHDVSVLPQYNIHKELHLPGNTVVADTGWIFLIVPAIIPNELNNTGKWQVIDSEMRPYPLLKTLSFFPGSKKPSPSKQPDLQYQIYKIPESKAKNKFYVLWQMKNRQFCWVFK